jgi:hypothetical protein
MPFGGPEKAAYCAALVTLAATAYEQTLAQRAQMLTEIPAEYLLEALNDPWRASGDCDAVAEFVRSCLLAVALVGNRHEVRNHG